NPIRQSAVAHLCVIPGANPRQQVEAVFGAELGEGAQIALPAPVELAADFFMVDPDDIGRDDIDSGGLHLEEFFFPKRPWITRVVEFPHHWKPWPAVERKVAAVQPKHMA